MTLVSGDYTVKEIIPANAIFRFGYTDVLPPLGDFARIAIFVGNHSRFTSGLSEAVDAFCEKYGAVVFCVIRVAIMGGLKCCSPY